MHTRLRQSLGFVAMASCGSISLAATDLLLEQPSVPMQMKQLEEQIGLRLARVSNTHCALPHPFASRIPMDIAVVCAWS